MGRRCSKDRQSIAKIENGKVNPTLFTLLEVANALGVSLSKLLFEWLKLKAATCTSHRMAPNPC
ncbi:MAG: helix-turn-helix domain-containing protein [Fluviicola sp.]